MRIAISAGDPSGDEHGAKIVHAIRAIAPNAEIFGMGGTHLRDAAVETVIDAEKDASVMGIIDVVKSLSSLRRAFNTLVDSLKERKPEVILLIDYQDFNLLLARAAKKLGIHTVFYIAPTVWAWRQGRAKRFRKYVDQLACIFPFEPQVFQKLGYHHATFVGHPFTDDLSLFTRTEEQVKSLRNMHGIPLTSPVVALFPGSRKQEIQWLLEGLLSGFKEAKLQIPTLHGVLPIPSSIDMREIQQVLGSNTDIHLMEGQSLDALRMSDCGVIKSGTSNLQAAMTGLPFTMVYRAGWLVTLIAKTCLQTKDYSIVNIIRPNTVREITSPQEFTARKIAHEIHSLLSDKERIKQIRQELIEVKEYLMPHDSETTTASRVARMVITP